MYKSVLITTLVILFYFISNAKISPNDKNAKRFKNISYVIFKNSDNTYGYNILSSGKIIIHQPIIPCIQTNFGFASPIKAEQVAKLVITKINSGLFPPTLTINEVIK